MSMYPLRDWSRRHEDDSDTVFVRDLSANAVVGVDAWGRKKKQPLQISVKVSLAQPFASAAEQDQVDQSTVHYGLLSKAVKSMIEAHAHEELSLASMSDKILDAALDSWSGAPEGLMDAIQIWVFLPKASLLGRGIQLHYCHSFSAEKSYGAKARVLSVRDVMVPSIVGVNRHERGMKQLVVLNLWIDPLWNEEASDSYGEVEQLMVKIWFADVGRALQTVEEGQFETLETLATKVASTVIKHFVFRALAGAKVRVRAEKPSAVPDATASGVEITRRSGLDDQFANQVWAECGRQIPSRIPFPFPLTGRLDEYLESKPS
ncbi:MAG: hypothetical protein M1817_003400 [Caeruleum heppii]|nr:MAG: hypothetical protein M1817_003400 [Caeruleum heppii]